MADKGEGDKNVYCLAEAAQDVRHLARTELRLEAPDLIAAPGSR